MRTFLTSTLLICIFGLAIFVAFMLFGGSQEQSEVISDVPDSTNQIGNAVTTPYNSASEPAMTTLETLYGQTLTINNFKIIEKVRPVGVGMYTLDSNQGYQIIFNESNSSFAINISKQPVISTRDQAVQALADDLGVSVLDLCLLNIYISTTYDFDPTTAGRNLGVGACNN